MNYETAIKIFDQLDDDEKVKDVYAHFGAAIYYAQVLEQQAINMIACSIQVNNKMNSIEEINSLWNRYDFGIKTLGSLINEIKTLYNISENDAETFKKVLKLRNYLTHDYFRFNTELFYNDSGMKRMIKDFIDFKDQAIFIDKKFINYLKKYTIKIGLTDEKIADMMEMNKKAWEKFVINEDHATILK